MRTIYGIQGNDSITFLDLIAAERHLYQNYPEYMSTKEQCMEYCESMIWEDTVTIHKGEK